MNANIHVTVNSQIYYHMSLKTYFFSLYSSTLLALAVWLSILFYTDPATADLVTVIAFFVSFFLWFSGAVSFLLFQIKITLSRREIIYAHIPTSIRQATLCSATLTLLAVLKALQTLNIWSAILVVTIFILLELFFQSKKMIDFESQE